MNAVNVVDIERSLRLLATDGSTFEVRAISAERGRKVTYSGYFTDPKKAASEIAHTCTNAIGVYTTLNPVRPELLARCAHRIAPVLEKNTTTGDQHIVRRRRLLIDIDGVPVAGISASEQEHQAALDLASEIEHELTQRGWPQPLRGDSGNGAHLDYAIDLPADDGGLVERVLHAAQAHFGCTLSTGSGDITLKVDTTNKNPSRITKIFGTPARKGDNLPERPHRMSCIVSAPEVLEVVPRELLEAFADEYAPRAETQRQQSTPRPMQQRETLDAEAWLAKHGIAVKNTNRQWVGKQGPGTLFELEECPGNSDHSRGEAHVEQHASGAITAGCQHQSCTWDWDWLREKYDGPKETRHKRNQRAPHETPADDLAERRERKRRKAQYDMGGDSAGYGPGGGYRLTDLGNARRFADANTSRLRYVKSRGQWLVWDGRRWKPDQLSSESKAAKSVVAGLYAEVASVALAQAEAVNAGSAPSNDYLDGLKKWAADSAKAPRVAAMIKLAESEPEIAAESSIWDSDPWLLNVANGTIDLRTGSLRPHRQDDMITKISPAEFDENARAPEWQRFLSEVVPDLEVQSWLQRFLGYCLTGSVREQKFSFWVGKGGNGKNVMADAVIAAMGEYAMIGAPDLLLEKKNEAHPTELADIEGRRLVLCSEIEPGRSWAEARIKQITGDKTIKARRMKQDFYEFDATSKLVVLANTKPRVRGTDDGIWRRMCLVPWTVQIAEEKKDRQLLSRLVGNELPGILAWLVRGCLEWQRSGLRSANAIDKATADYRANQDTLGLWIRERCLESPHAWAATAALYEDYIEWCKVEQISHPWARRTFRERLLERTGISEHDKTVARGLSGIQLLTSVRP